MLILVVFFTISISPRKPHVSRIATGNVVAEAAVAPVIARRSLKRACGGCPGEAVVSRIATGNHV